MKSFSLLIKPASADCNLRCEYCFYLEKAELYSKRQRHRMSDQILQTIIRSYMATKQEVYSFAWQGGEPTLMGLDFFRRVTELQEHYGKRIGAHIFNGLQTNATLIDDDFAEHLATYRFLLGVSIDGPKEMHDMYRKNVSAEGSHADVLKGIHTLQKHNVDFNALVLVNSTNVHHPDTVYHYLCDLGITHHQYISCVEFDSKGNLLPYSITGKEWGDFLNKIFDIWSRHDISKVSVRFFDSILQFLLTGEYIQCTMAGYCNRYFVVEYNGDIYPCDFFVQPKTYLGNIQRDSWNTLIQSKKYHKFAGQKANWNNKCNTCPYLPYCSGDCLKHRFYGRENPQHISRLCQGWQQFYGHALPRLKEIALTVLNNQEQQKPPHLRRYYNELPSRKPKMNDSCYCGSGKKYKDCHGFGARV